MLEHAAANFSPLRRHSLTAEQLKLEMIVENSLDEEQQPVALLSLDGMRRVPSITVNEHPTEVRPMAFDTCSMRVEDEPDAPVESMSPHSEASTVRPMAGGSMADLFHAPTPVRTTSPRRTSPSMMSPAMALIQDHLRRAQGEKSVHYTEV